MNKEHTNRSNPLLTIDVTGLEPIKAYIAESVAIAKEANKLLNTAELDEDTQHIFKRIILAQLHLSDSLGGDEVEQ